MRQGSRLNIVYIPMLDIVFLLLVFFIVNTMISQAPKTVSAIVEIPIPDMEEKRPTAANLMIQLFKYGNTTKFIIIDSYDNEAVESLRNNDLRKSLIIEGKREELIRLYNQKNLKYEDVGNLIRVLGEQTKRNSRLKDNPKAKVVVRIEPDVKYEYMVKTIKACNDLGILEIGCIEGKLLYGEGDDAKDLIDYIKFDK